jgi:hypothetical protein
MKRLGSTYRSTAKKATIGRTNSVVYDGSVMMRIPG